MTTTTPSLDFAPHAAGARPIAAGRRDPRLDFYRGIAMFIILAAHVPGNWWASWIPARFGPSDATEIFVFCSGMASAVAFGGTFARAGWWLGTARTAYRIWQVYWAHIGLFFVVAMTMAGLETYGDFDKSYIDTLNLRPFFEDPMPQLVGLFTLTYVPNYFDILPMYLGILAMLPAMMALARLHPWLAMGASVAVWGVTQTGAMALPAEPWSEREWFFNPFGWQLVFFTGFAFMRGWLPPPPVRGYLIWAALAVVLLLAPVGSWKVAGWVEDLAPAAGAWLKSTFPDTVELRRKTEFGILRYVHFLSLAYLFWVLAGEHGRRLQPSGDGGVARLWSAAVAVVRKVGQQSLAVFVFSMAFARILGVALDQAGRTASSVAAANLFGFLCLAGVAYGVAWVKGAPWKPAAA